MAKRTYGWKPDLPDQRDRLYSARVQPGVTLPSSVDLRPHCSAIEDQGALGSCTGNGIVGALEVLASQAGKPVDLSRLFVYYEERVIEGTVRQDCGAMIRTGIKVIAKIGAPLERYWPYDIKAFMRKPGKRAYNDAPKRRVNDYERVGNLHGLKVALASNLPVVFGFSVYDSFQANSVEKTGVVPMPEAHERMLGGHCVLAVGYDDATQCVRIRNSYGATWGEGGYGWMPYAYFDNKNLSADFWLIRR